MTMRRRLSRLEQALPAPDPEEELRRQRWLKVVDRFFRQLEQAVALLNPEEEQGVEKALVDLSEPNGCRGPYADWLRALEFGWCRLPRLTPGAMKDLLLAWLLPGVNGVVCKSCGLEVPEQNYCALFQACPGCGGSTREWDWPHLVKDYDRAWKALDGYVSSPNAKGGREPAQQRPPPGTKERP